VGDLLALDDPPPALVQTLAARARGNPARLVEALRAAAGRGAIVRRAGRWEVEHAEVSGAIPGAPYNPGVIGRNLG